MAVISITLFRLLAKAGLAHDATISGVTVATLLLTCLIFLVIGWTGSSYYVTALSEAFVCIAASNGGATAQDLAARFLVAVTPKRQQVAILLGALASLLALGPILLSRNDAATVYVLAARAAPGLATDPARLAHAGEGLKFDAPKATLMSYIIKGILDRQLPWGLVLFGVMIALVLGGAARSGPKLFCPRSHWPLCDSRLRSVRSLPSGQARRVPRLRARQRRPDGHHRASASALTCLRKQHPLLHGSGKRSSSSCTCGAPGRGPRFVQPWRW